MSLRLVLVYKLSPGQPRLHRETFYLEKQTNKKKEAAFVFGKLSVSLTENNDIQTFYTVLDVEASSCHMVTFHPMLSGIYTSFVRGNSWELTKICNQETFVLL